MFYLPGILKKIQENSKKFFGMQYINIRQIPRRKSFSSDPCRNLSGKFAGVYKTTLSAAGFRTAVEGRAFVGKVSLGKNPSPDTSPEVLA